MNKVFKTFARTISIATIAALLWGLTGGLPALGPLKAGQTGQASAAALTVQSVSTSPLNVSNGKGAKAPGVPETAVGTGFTYQGRLMDNSVPANGQYDLRFALFDAQSGGNQVSSIVTLTSQTVSSGLFTVSLDFGASVFNGQARWLEIGAKASGGGTFTTLSPRQPLTAVPYSASSRWEGTSNKPFPYNPLPQANVISNVDPAGQNVSMAIGADGLGLMSYQDTQSHTLKVAHCGNPACTFTTNTTTIDDTTNVGEYNAITIGADGLGIIAYSDAFASNLLVAHCSDITCSSATVAISIPGHVLYPSITIGVDGLPLISFFDFTGPYNQGNYMVVHCSDAVCNSAAPTLIRAGNTWPSWNTSITIGADGMGIIALYGNPALSTAHCSNVACSSVSLTALDNSAFGDYSITTGADGFPLISSTRNLYHVGGFLRVTHCADITCNPATATITTIDTDTVQYTSVSIGADGLGLISYFDVTTGSLKIAHCSNVACSAAITTTIETAYPGVTSVTMGPDGLPLIAYSGNSQGGIKVLHCASPLCVSYQHRR